MPKNQCAGGMFDRVDKQRLVNVQHVPIETGSAGA